MTGWFGEPWPSETLRAPICENDDERVPTPVGDWCVYCEELIESDDRGMFISAVEERVTCGPNGEDLGIPPEHLRVVDRPEHIECSIRSVAGPVAYLEGRCTHAGGTENCHVEGQSLREDALATYEWLQTHGWPA